RSRLRLGNSRSCAADHSGERPVQATDKPSPVLRSRRRPPVLSRAGVGRARPLVCPAMPELPEVETVCRGLRPALVGKRIARVRVMRPDLRWPLPPGLGQALTGRRVEAIDRRAKYILVRLDDANTMLAHLGMTGSMRVKPADPNRALLPHDHVVLETADGISVTFHDPRRFGMIDLVPAAEVNRHKLLAGLGPEPLDDSFNAATLSAALAGKRT